jgi:hypothetical protein
MRGNVEACQCGSTAIVHARGQQGYRWFGGYDWHSDPLGCNGPARRRGLGMTAQEGTVYLLCFTGPDGRPRRYRHAGHYCGWTAGPVEDRLAQHVAGQGSPLVRAVLAAGLTVQLVATWPGTRALERRLKVGPHGVRTCPRCRAYRPPKPRQLRLPMIRKGGRQCAASPAWLWRVAA